MTGETVFLDTVGLIAVWDVADQWHEDAESVFKRISTRRTRLVTTTFVLIECGNASARRPYRARVDALRLTLELRREVVTPDENDWTQAWAAYGRGEAAQAGIVDHVSFIVMRRLGLTQAFTNDRHFQAAGFTTLF